LLRAAGAFQPGNDGDGVHAKQIIPSAWGHRLAYLSSGYACPPS
jgi:hypothetical protein